MTWPYKGLPPPHQIVNNILAALCRILRGKSSRWVRRRAGLRNYRTGLQMQPELWEGRRFIRHILACRCGAKRYLGRIRELTA